MVGEKRLFVSFNGKLRYGMTGFYTFWQEAET